MDSSSRNRILKGRFYYKTHFLTIWNQRNTIIHVLLMVLMELVFFSNLLDEEGCIDIIVRYQFKIPFQLLPIGERQMIQRVRLRGWTGRKSHRHIL